MTTANRLIEHGLVLTRVFDPEAAGFTAVQNHWGTFNTAVFSVLLARRAFWTTQSLAFGFAVDRGAPLDDVAQQQFAALLTDAGFQDYAIESELDPRSETLSAVATTLDALFNVEMRQAAMFVNTAVDQCIQNCPTGDDSCIRRCIIEWG